MSRPPRLVGAVILSHLTKWSFLFSSMEPQRKSLVSLSTLSWTLVGSLQHYIVYLVIGVTEALMRTSLLAGKRHLVFQLVNLAWTLSTTDWN